MFQAIRGMVKDICEAHSVFPCRMVDETRADAPEEAVGAAVTGMRLVVEQQRARAVDAARELACERPLPAQHHRRAEADSLRVTVDAILCRVADRATQCCTVIDGDVVYVAILAIDMDVVIIDIRFSKKRPSRYSVWISHVRVSFVCSFAVFASCSCSNAVFT